jgi:uncharacterized protein YdhG (YjbR/CyaY superfamily)
MATAKKTTARFTAEERAAMKERAKELKSGDAANDVTAKIAEFTPADRAMAETIHEIVTSTAPDLTPRLWYGQPAYAKDGKVLCFFQPADKFKTRYATLGFTDVAALDDGSMWPTAFALTKLSAADEKKIRALVKKAAG